MTDETKRLEAVLAIAKACDTMRTEGVKGWQRVLREAVFFFWETRELGKFSQGRPHSVAARALTENRLKRYDHAVPLRMILPELVECQTADQLKDVLSRVQAFLITVEEDRALNSAGLRQRMPDGWDGKSIPARYEALGMVIDGTPEVAD